ncbi:dihydroneopterin aldolase [Microterricola pindariensis]|uniref:dihydroneopterin aldolase n=1 Tax=Microterricola pindariensis TaxID=478010 RepID=UPI001E4F3818|nr:dihydroneopterin aldolase [Microterricola pindariensis]
MPDLNAVRQSPDAPSAVVDWAARDHITLTGLRVQAHHGVFDFERENGQAFVADVTVWLDFAAAAAGDELAATIHYGVLAEEVAAAVQRDPVDLIETVVERIAATVLAHPAAQRVRVTLHKPDAPITVPFDDVSVTITRERS